MGCVGDGLAGESGCWMIASLYTCWCVLSNLASISEGPVEVPGAFKGRSRDDVAMDTDPLDEELGHRRRDEGEKLLRR